MNQSAVLICTVLTLGAGLFGAPGYAATRSYARPVAPYRYAWQKPFQPIISLDLDPQQSRNSALRIAARENRVSEMERLLRDGAQIDASTASGRTALMLGARSCHDEAVRILLEKGANASLVDRKGRTALMWATQASCLPVVKLLLGKRPMNTEVRDKARKTALDYAVEAAALEVDGPSIEIIRLLRRHSRPSRKVSLISARSGG